MNTNFKLEKQDLKLALVDSTSATLFTGFDYGKWFSNSYFGSVAGKYFTLLPGVKSSTKVNKMDAVVGSVMQDDDGTYNSSNITISQIKLDVQPKKVNVTVPISVLETGFVSTSLQAGSNNVATPNNFLTYFLEYVGKITNHEIELLTWSQSDSEGLTYKLSASTATTKVTAVSAVTSSNIVGEISRVYTAISNTVIGDPALKIYLSSDLYYAYQLSFASQALSSSVFNGDVSNMKFLNIPVIEAKGAPTKKMYAFTDTNAVYAFDGSDDISNISIIDFWNNTGVPSIGFASRAKLGFDIIVKSEAVLYA